MTRHRSRSLFSIALVCVLMYTFLFGATTVFADEPTPAANPEETTALSADESQSEPPAEIEADPDDEQVEAPDAGTTAPASPQDEQANPAEGSIAVEALPEGEAGTPFEPLEQTSIWSHWSNCQQTPRSWW